MHNIHAVCLDFYETVSDVIVTAELICAAIDERYLMPNYKEIGIRYLSSVKISILRWDRLVNNNKPTRG